MSADVLTQEPSDLKTGDADSGGGRTDGVGYGDYGSSGERARRIDTAKLGLWIALGSVTMLFSAFTSAYIVRSAGNDWVPLEAPGVLWINTLVLLVSSVTIELSRRAFRSFKPLAFRKWMFASAVLGSLFVAGQFLAWRELARQGVYLASHPHSSFFYVLTGVHGVHLIAGIVAVFYVLARAARYRLTPGESVAPDLAATYWHFVDGLWLYLILVLFFL
jgi:cytochrome c oxidase subunit 3